MKYNLAESTLTYWKKEEYKLREITDKNKRITIHPGRKNIYPDIDEKLINFIEFNRKLLNPITTFSIASEMFRLFPQLKNKKYKSILNWIYRFLNRNHYTFRKHTHLGKLLPPNSFDTASIFFIRCIYEV